MSNRANYVAIGVICAAVASGGCGGVPQMGGNESCMRAADALWTAISLRQSDLLEQSAGEIARLHAEGALADEPHEALSRIIEHARSGQWDAARTTLKPFIRGQRRAKESTG